MTQASRTTTPDASGLAVDPATATCAARLLEAAKTVLARWERGDLAAAIRDLDLFTPTDGDRP